MCVCGGGGWWQKFCTSTWKLFSAFPLLYLFTKKDKVQPKVVGRRKTSKQSPHSLFRSLSSDSDQEKEELSLGQRRKMNNQSYSPESSKNRVCSMFQKNFKTPYDSRNQNRNGPQSRKQVLRNLQFCLIASFLQYSKPNH